MTVSPPLLYRGILNMSTASNNKEMITAVCGWWLLVLVFLRLYFTEMWRYVY